jgi:hypothetical protein
MRRLPLWLAAAFVAACDPATQPADPAAAGPTFAANSSTEITRTQQIAFTGPVSTACVGEVVELHLREIAVFHQTTDASGGVHVHINIADQGSFGIGLTSGTTYRFGGAFQETANEVLGPGGTGAEDTFVTNIILIGHGRRIVYEEFFHVTFNAQGELVSLKETGLIVKQCSAAGA